MSSSIDGILEKLDFPTNHLMRRKFSIGGTSAKSHFSTNG